MPVAAISVPNGPAGPNASDSPGSKEAAFPFAGEQVGVVGLGRSGVAAARFCAARGAQVLACDENPGCPGARELADAAGIVVRLGPLPRVELGGCARVILSPGAPRSHPALAGLPLTNDIETLHRWIESQPDPAPIAAITGSNGKSTVTTLVGMMLADSGIDAAVGGNLGQAALSLWRPEAAVYVLELSSFQLESIDRFRPKVAALLNLSPDHMDRYAGLADYLAAKQRIFRNQGPEDWAVVNADDPALAETVAQIEAAPRRWLPFSIENPLPGRVCLVDDCLVDWRHDIARVLIPQADIRMVGRHNLANAAAAAAIALAMGAKPVVIGDVLARFPGLPHRMEHVGDIDGVPYYNDSKGTNVGAVIASLTGFDRDVVLIAGGRDKQSDFAPLARAAQGRVRAAVLIGEAADDLARAFAGRVPVERAADMADAVARARRLVPPGGRVLLSPACASFDMFENFEERGERFREAVDGLR